MSEKRTVAGLGINVWIAIIGLVVTLITGGGVILSQIYAQKTEVAEVKEELSDKITEAETQSDTKLQNWRIQTIEVKVENLNTRQQQTSENVVKLLERFRVKPVADPVMKPLPAPPPP
jgi:hypothetical protein